MNGAPRMAPTPTSSAVCAAGEHDRDDRHEGLGEGRAHRREDAAHRALAELVAPAEPLDAVGEQLGRGEDDGEGDQQEKDGHDGGKDTRRGGPPAAARPVCAFALRGSDSDRVQTQPFACSSGTRKYRMKPAVAIHSIQLTSLALPWTTRMSVYEMKPKPMPLVML